MKDVVIVDYGMANLRSVQKAFSRLGVDATITADPNRVSQSSHLVLPGVGAFADAIAALRSTGLDQPILEHLRADRPFLGICLGLQMLFERGLEDGEHRRLSDGEAHREATLHRAVLGNGDDIVRNGDDGRV